MNDQKQTETKTHIFEFGNVIKNVTEGNELLYDDLIITQQLQHFHSTVQQSIAKEIEKIIHVALYNMGRSKIDTNLISVELQLIWSKVHEPLFSWFRYWRNELISQKRERKQIPYTEIRVMNGKLTKLFKSCHRFYYQIIEYFAYYYDTSFVIPMKVISSLNLDKIIRNPSDKIILKPDNQLGIIITMAFHVCLTNIAMCQYFKTVSERMDEVYKESDMKKSERYLNFSLLMLPAVGTSYYQISILNSKTNQFSRVIYNLIRASLARMPCKNAIKQLKDFFTERGDELRVRYDNHSSSLLNPNIGNQGKSLCNMQFDLCFVSLFGYYYKPDHWSNPQDHKKLNCKTPKKDIIIMFRHCIKNLSPENIESALLNLLTVIGGFTLLVSESTSNISALTLIDLDNIQVEYLNFSFNYFALLIDDLIRAQWRSNLEKYEYLAIVRIVLCWLKCHRVVLQFAHRNEHFCSSLASLINDIITFAEVDKNILSGLKPKRQYFFEEDVLVKEFACLKYILTDCNDKDIVKKNNVLNRVIGYPPKSERLSKYSEGIIRLEAIVTASTKFLKQSDCGMEWDETQGRYIVKLLNAFDLEGVRISDLLCNLRNSERVLKSQKKKRELKTSNINVTDLERTLSKIRKDEEPGIIMSSSFETDEISMVEESSSLLIGSDMQTSEVVVVSGSESPNDSIDVQVKCTQNNSTIING